MTDVISRIPQLNINDESLRPCALLQNLPSIICGLVLNPQPNEIILDMCAAPGNKTTHISLLMKGQVNIKRKKKFLSIKFSLGKKSFFIFSCT